MLPIKFDEVLFIDVETVGQESSFSKLDSRGKELWNKKAASFFKVSEKETPAALYERAGIYAEFGKIICITVGYIAQQNGKRSFRLKSFFGDDEKKVIGDFFDLLNAKPKSKSKLKFNEYILCAHNGKEFDFPYIGRRAIINQLKLPSELSIQGKKPWEIQHLDTMELWRFGDYKSYTSLDLLAYALGIETPKKLLDGSKVNATYYQKNDLQAIVDYCRLDVLTVAQIILRMHQLPLIEKKEMVIV